MIAGAAALVAGLFAGASRGRAKTIETIYEEPIPEVVKPLVLKKFEAIPEKKIERVEPAKTMTGDELTPRGVSAAEKEKLDKYMFETKVEKEAREKAEQEAGPQELEATMTKAEIDAGKKELSEMSKNVIFQRNVTMQGIEGVVNEKPFQGRTVNGYKWDNTEQGVYVSALSGVPLFSSKTKYYSADGYSGFWAPISKDVVIERTFPRDKDRLFLLRRIQVLDRASKTHLGFLAEDGPNPTGIHYQIQAAALRFVPGEAPAGDPDQTRGRKLSIFS